MELQLKKFNFKIISKKGLSIGFKEKIYNFYKLLTHPKVVKFSCIAATSVWISSVILAIFFGQLDPVILHPIPLDLIY